MSGLNLPAKETRNIIITDQHGNELVISFHWGQSSYYREPYLTFNGPRELFQIRQESRIKESSSGD